MAKNPSSKAATHLDEKSVCMIVEFNRMGNTRKVDTAQITVQTDKSLLKVTKSLLDCKEFEDIKSFDGFTKRHLYSLALPSMFKDGIFRIPNTLLVQIDEYMEERKLARLAYVKAFKKAYPGNVATAIARLDALGDANNYPSAEEAAADFSMVWRYVAFSVPDSLKAIKKGLFEREQKKTETLFIEANEEIRGILRQNMMDFVENLCSKLADDTDGKSKRIHPSKLEKMNQFIESFNARNIVDDSQLKTLVDKARSLMKGVEKDDLKNDNLTRDKVKEGFDGIKKALGKMIEDKPTRKYKF